MIIFFVCVIKFCLFFKEDKWCYNLILVIVVDFIIFVIFLCICLGFNVLSVLGLIKILFGWVKVLIRFLVFLVLIVVLFLMLLFICVSKVVGICKK